MRKKALPLALAMASIAANQAGAQNDQNGDIYELITTAIHVQQSETALPVTVLTGDALREAARSTLGETLSGQPGISSASFGPAVGQTVIRGQQGRRVLTMSNGIPNADASGNSVDHAQTAEAILARSIEVLRGPSTLLYGGGAIGGVVNVIDNRIPSSLSDTPSFAFEARHDTAADTSTLVGAADFSTGNLAWHFDAMQREWNDVEISGFAIDPRYLEDEHEEEHEEEEHDEEHEEEEHEEVENTLGFIENTGGKTRNATAGASWIMDNGFIGLAVTRLDNEYGLPPGAHSHAHEHEEEHDEEHEEEEHEEEEHEEEHGEDFVFIDMERTRVDLSGEWENPASWAETFSYKLSYTDYKHAEIEGDGSVGTRFSNDSWQHRAMLTHTDTTERHGVLGLQHESQEFAAIGDESFIPVTESVSTGIFAVEDFHLGAFTTEIGARYSRDEYDPQDAAVPDRDFSGVSLSASGLWDFSANTTLGLSLSRSQRAPSIEELYSNYGLVDPETCVIHFATGACEIGSTGFSEETSLNADLTLYLEYSRFSATVTAFHNRFSDYIGQISTGEEVDEFPIREYRQDDAKFSGIEVDANIRLNELLALRLFGDTITGNFDNLGDVPRLPPTRYGMELMFERDAWSAGVTVIHADEQDEPGSAEFSTDSWTRVDLKADYRIPAANGELLLFIKGRNLGDEEIRLSTSYLRGFAPEAGRSIETGVRYTF